MLIALLSPALSKMRESARSLQCMNNLRQITLASTTYAQEHDGLFFMQYHIWAVASKEWHLKLYETGYLKDFRVCICPSHPPKEYSQGNKYYVYGLRDYRAADSNYVRDAGSCYNGNTFLQLYGLTDPSNYYLFADSSYGSGRENNQCYLLQSTPDTNVGGVQTRHVDLANVSFADGHVESCNQMRLKSVGFSGGLDKKTRLVIRVYLE
ncbi:MAG: DUF1559 domain-containing protein [Verrucomicrobiae bacterium]|nr:DUF1559 domain-containing protein [Verrucomicrobiae bacterium]